LTQQLVERAPLFGGQRHEFGQLATKILYTFPTGDGLSILLLHHAPTHYRHMEGVDASCNPGVAHGSRASRGPNVAINFLQVHGANPARRRSVARVANTTVVAHRPP
jgi:hypothetical protein